MRVFLLVVLSLVVGCKSGADRAGEPPELRLLMTGAYGGTEEPGLEVIRDEGSLRKYFAKINRMRKPGLPVPEIDFSSQIALLYCSGRTTDTVMPLLYTREETDQRILIGRRMPSAVRDSTHTAQQLPFAIYIMPATGKTIELED